MSSEIDLSRLPEEDAARVMKSLNNKPLYKDPTSLTPDSITNCLCIQPFRTLTSHNYFIKKNLIYIPETEEYIYNSGHNIIVEKISNKSQEIIPLTHRCNVTSLTYVKSPNNKKMVFIGEKLFPDEKNMINGGIEIIQIEDKNCNKKLSLNMGAYVNYNNYVYDIIAKDESEILVIILKNLNTSINEVKLFFYNYVNFTLVDIEDIKYNITDMQISPHSNTQYLLTANNYCGIWDFFLNKLQLILNHQFYANNKDNIVCTEFIKAEGKEGIAISFKNEYFEIFLKKGGLEEKFVLFLRIDLFTLFKDIKEEIVKSHNEEENEEKESDRVEEKEKQGPFLDNLIVPETSDFIANFTKNIYSSDLNKEENYVKFIICRKNLIFVFLAQSQAFIVLELINNDDSDKIKVINMDLLAHKINENSRIDINEDMNNMILTNGELEDSYLLSPNKMNENNLIYMDKSYENNFTLQKCTLKYYKYKINYINAIPNFNYEKELLQNSSLFYPIQSLSISRTPRLILINTGNDGQSLMLYRHKILSNLTEYKSKHNFESSYISQVQIKHFYYQDNSSFELLNEKKLDDTPLSIAFSPQGKSFFISFKDCGYLYIILERDIKEVFKIAMYCRSCVFDETGMYLAFGTSEFDNEYNINILNLSTYEYEYIITRVPQPSKIVFCDGVRNLIAQFNDNSTNLLGWALEFNNRLIDNAANTQRGFSEKTNRIILKVSDFTGNIVDFGYDYSLDMCIISSHDKRIRIYCGAKEDKHWEFSSDLEYSRLLIIKKYDAIIFGTSEGSLRCCIWPIQNLGKNLLIDHPEFIETKLHNQRITSLSVSKNLEILYSSAEDGSIFVSSISGLSNDVQLKLNSFYYFDNRNVLQKNIYFSQDEIMYINDNIYRAKVDNLRKKKSVIQGLISEFQSKKEKIIQNNMTDLENQRTSLTELLEQQIKEVKNKENEKEKETKKLKDERDQQVQKSREELDEMKKKFKVIKEKKQTETTKLINCIKFAREKFEQKQKEIESLRDKTNNNITQNLKNILNILQNKKDQIDKLVEENKKNFEKDCKKNETVYEAQLRQKNATFKEEMEEFELEKKEVDNEIIKKEKDNKNYDEKIGEWENHLKELKLNNEELMETYIFNTLKLNQMNQLLTDNENKISIKEKIVKEKRLINDRLEQLRYVLEYQIKNLILEKTPIEEQIKNFEALHADFYKRFNLLYVELLNIGDLIDNNQRCIDTYRNELSETKKSLYRLKNLYKTIDVCLNSILKNKLDTKQDIISQIFQVYQTYLYPFNDTKKQTKYISNEMKLQTKNIEKEISNQKNNVLKELIDKRAERRRIIKEKDEMMKDIRLDNQLLIQECSNIRENLEDILININDIEKKFIELTNNNTLLADKNNNSDIQAIQGKIKMAKQTILLSDEDKTRVGKVSNQDKLPPIKSKKLIPIVSNGNMDILDADELLKKQKINSEELMKQQKELEEIEKKYKDFVSEHEINKSDIIKSNRNEYKKKTGDSKRFAVKGNK